MDFDNSDNVKLIFPNSGVRQSEVEPANIVDLEELCDPPQSPEPEKVAATDLRANLKEAMRRLVGSYTKLEIYKLFFYPYPLLPLLELVEEVTPLHDPKQRYSPVSRSGSTSAAAGNLIPKNLAAEFAREP